MADIFVEIAGQKTQVTKSRLFELAKQGVILPNTPLWYGEKETVCGRVTGLVFSAVPAPPSASAYDDDDDEEPGQIFATREDELPERPVSQPVFQARQSQDEIEALEQAEEKKQKKIVLIVTIVSVLTMMIMIRGITCFMSDLNTKVKKKATTEKKSNTKIPKQIPQRPLPLQMPQTPPEQAPPQQAPPEQAPPKSTEDEKVQSETPPTQPSTETSEAKPDTPEPKPDDTPAP